MAEGPRSRSEGPQCYLNSFIKFAVNISHIFYAAMVMLWRPNRLFARKRKRGFMTNQAKKKRRTVRPRRYNQISTRQNNFSTLGYRSRRLSRRRWRNVLWRDTLAQQHYLSSSTTFTTFSLGGTANPATVDSDVGNAGAIPNSFWTTAGGANGADGSTMPTVHGDVVIRGGRISIEFLNPDNTTNPQTVFVRLWLVQLKDEWDSTIPATTLFKLDDFSRENDFHSKFGRVLRKWEFPLRTEGSWKVQHRLPVRKIDQDVFGNAGGNYIWYYAMYGSEDINTIINVVYGHNLSFSANVV